MRNEGNVLMRALPWVLTILVSVFACVGWAQYRSARKKLAARAACEEPSGTAAAPADDRIPADAPRPDALEVRRPNTPASGPAVPEACLALPAVQLEIRRQADLLAEERSEQRVEDYQKEEQERRTQRRQHFMENFEVASANAVNAYAREARLDEAVTVKLHQAIEDGIQKQRELQAKVKNGELTGREAREQGRQLMTEGRAKAVELLGEPGADRFFKLLGEEMQKEFERRPPAQDE